MNLLWLRPGVVGGSEQFLVRLLTGLARRGEPGIDLRLYVLPEFAVAHPELASSFSTAIAPIEDATPARRVLCEQRWLPRRLATDAVDVTFHAGGTMPLRPGPRPVLLVHDVQYLDHPEWFSRVKRAYLRAQVPRGVKAADLVAAPSQHAVDRLVEAFHLDPARTAVLPHGIDAPAWTAEPMSVERPVVLYPAITYPHKNHQLLLRAMEHMQTQAQLVLVGGEAGAEAEVAELIATHGLADRVTRTGRVDDVTLERWWATADVLAWPSVYEGFGAPLVEAMLRQVPVVASAHTSVPEVVGDGGRIVDSTDPAAWAAALDEALQPGHAADLVRAGVERASHFSVDRGVDALLAAIDRAGGGRATID